MANKRIKDLSTASSIAGGQYLAVDSTSGGTLKIDYNLLAKAIIEQYSSSTLAGSAQTLQSAINSLNSDKANASSVFSIGDDGTTIPSNDDLNNYTTVGNYKCASASVATSLSNKPSDLDVGFTMKVMTGNSSNVQIQWIVASSSDIRQYFRRHNSSGFGDWKKITPSSI